MKASKVRKLAAAGWRTGSAREFLELSDEEALLVEMRLALSRSVRKRREDLGLTQTQLASRLGSSQSRIAKLEAADPEVSFELFLRSLLALGAGRKDIARAIAA
jgi:ribosome-binding protein aMBF1 (putative translation factor)